ncbi:unnamed protein product, partial [Heterotrigona itama]
TRRQLTKSIIQRSRNRAIKAVRDDDNDGISSLPARYVSLIT